jgi:hypothetical protein
MLETDSLISRGSRDTVHLVSFEFSSVIRSDNAIGSEGAKALAVSLENLNALAFLGFRFCNSIRRNSSTTTDRNTHIHMVPMIVSMLIPDCQCACMSTYSVACPDFHRGNAIGPDGAKALAVPIEKLAALQSLDFR